MEDRLLYLPEVAEQLRRSEAQMRWMHQNGKGPRFARIGGRLMAKASDVTAWIDAQFDKESA